MPCLQVMVLDFDVHHGNGTQVSGNAHQHKAHAYPLANTCVC